MSTPTAFAVDMDRDGRAPLGFGYGVPAGMANGGLRLILGVWSIVTFPFVDINADRSFHFEPLLTGWNMLRPKDSGTFTPPAFHPPSRGGTPSLD